MIAATGEIPDGYLTIPLSEDQCTLPVRLCLLVRREPEPTGGHLVQLRASGDAEVFLGCMVDAAARILEWLEITVQQVDDVAPGISATRQSLSNQMLDARWERQAESLGKAGHAVIRGAWEMTSPRPMFIDLKAAAPVHLNTKQGTPYQLCTDDDVLRQHGLPAYSSSLHRYLYAPEADGQFLSVTEGAPADGDIQHWSEFLGQDCPLLPFNPGGGRLLISQFDPLDYETGLRMLGGGSWEGLMHGQQSLHLGALERQLDDRGRQDISRFGLLLGHRGRDSRLLEVLHLKIQWLTDVVADVARVTEALGRPLLDITTDSLRFRVPAASERLPFFWTLQPRVTTIGNAVSLALPHADTETFSRLGRHTASVFLPANAGASTRGVGTVRIRQLLDDKSTRTIVEGTLVTQEWLEASPNDVVWLRLRLGDTRLGLYGRVEAESALATGECRFRSLPMTLTAELRPALEQAAGVPLRRSPFEVLPCLASPCDMYSLGVVAVQTLLVDGKRALPKAVDEFFSLMRQLQLPEDGSAADMVERLAETFAADERWAASLGPQRLIESELEPDQALGMMPPELWWEVLGAVIRMFPGTTPCSYCRDLGDAPAGAPAAIYSPVLRDLEQLEVLTRSLVVPDWDSNQEIVDLISEFEKE